jgi:hypothetical protein
MIPTVYTLDEAMQWFLENSTGTVMCVKKDGAGSDAGKECSSYADAKSFYEQ